jgi:hypothetical protein
MADGFVQLNPDSSGKIVDTREVTRTSDGKVVERQGVTLVDPLDPASLGAAVNSLAPAIADLALRVRGLVTLEDISAALIELLTIQTNPLWLDPTTARLRVTVDNIAAALTLATITTVGTVTTVSTVTNMQQLAGFDVKQSLLYDAALMSHSNTVLRNMT